MTHDPQRTSTLPSGSDIRLPWHLRLPAPLEREFVDYFRSNVARITPWATITLVSILTLAVILELTVEPDLVALTWRPRLFCIMLAVATAVVAHRPDLRRWLHPMIILLAFAVAITGMWMGLSIDHPQAFLLFLQTPLAILVLGVLLRVPFLASALSTSAILALQALCTLAPNTLPLSQALTLLLFSLATGTMSLFGQYIYERLLRSHFLSEHVLYQHRAELHSANRVLESQATGDGLTGCLNRRGMESRLNDALHGRSRHAIDNVTVLLFDIDFFKQYNDTYGHLAGDECLKSVAGIPRGMAQGEADFVARYGGEEFLVALANTSLKDALVFAERMRTRIEQLGLPHAGSRVSQVVTISVGVASSLPGEKDVLALIKRADEALYQAKGAGRNCVAFMEELQRVQAL